ncbi:hypothetical protein [Eubacterium ramulus]
MSRVTEEIREEGRMEAKIEIANSLSEMGMPVEQIAQVLKVSVSAIQEWLSADASPVK